IVARTDAEAANLIESRADERDQPFLLGATNLDVPAYKAAYLALMKRFFDLGVRELNGHLLYALTAEEYAAAEAWLERHGLMAAVAEAASPGLAGIGAGPGASIDLFDKVESRFVETWVGEANLKTYGEAVADALAFRESEGDTLETSVEDWRRFASRASLWSAGEKARSLGVDLAWD